MNNLYDDNNSTLDNIFVQERLMAFHGRKYCYCLSPMKGCVIFSALLLSPVDITQPFTKLSQ